MNLSVEFRGVKVFRTDAFLEVTASHNLLSGSLVEFKFRTIPSFKILILSTKWNSSSVLQLNENMKYIHNLAIALEYGLELVFNFNHAKKYWLVSSQ